MRIRCQSSWALAATLLTAFLYGQSLGHIGAYVAGNDWPFLASYSGGPATQTPLGFVTDIALDSSGNVYFVDQSNNSVGKVSPQGTFTLLAGYGAPIVPVLPVVNGSANYPGIVVDKSGNVYFSEPNSFRVRKLTPAGVLTTFAGTGIVGNSGDNGPATAAKLTAPCALSLDGAGNLYISDTVGVIRKVDAQGTITTVAGGGRGSLVGPNGASPTNVGLLLPRAAADASGNLYIAAVGFVYAVLGGTMYEVKTLEGENIYGIGTDGQGNVFVAMRSQMASVKSLGNGNFTTAFTVFAGTGASGFAGDGGPAATALFAMGGLSQYQNGGGGIVFDSAGNLYVADSFNSRIRKIAMASANQTVTTVAGNGGFKYGGDGGLATAAFLNQPAALAFDAAGNLYVAEQAGNRVRKIDTTGIITTLAGNGSFAATGDGGSSANSSVAQPVGLAADNSGNLFIAQTGAGIRRLDAAGEISTLTGTNQFNAVAVGAGNTLYGIPQSSNQVDTIAASGAVTLVAGTGLFGIYSPTAFNGEMATLANLQPRCLGIDRFGSLLLPDASTYQIWRLSSGILNLFAGNGKTAYSGDGGLAVNAGIYQNDYPMATDSLGNVYFAENPSVRKVTPSGYINTVYTTPSGVEIAGGLAVDRQGRLYLPFNNDSIVRIEAVAPVLSSLSSPSANVGAPLALSVTGSGFDVDSVIQVAGTALTTTYVSAAQLQATIPTSSLTAAGTLAITVFNPALGGATSNSLGLSVVAQPVFTAAGVVNGASFQPGAAPGSIVSIFGSNLAGSTAAAFAIPLSKTLGGAAVSLNTTLLPLFYVSPGQINAQIPYTAAGSASLLVQYPGGSASQTITVVPVSPGIFTTNGAQGVIVNANGTLADASNPAPAGSIVVIYCTGLGAVTPPVVEGTAAPLNPPATTIATPQVLVGTTPSQEQAVLSFSGLSGGSVGLYQVNFQVPSDVSTGSIQIAISMGGVTSNVVTMAVMTQAK